MEAQKSVFFVYSFQKQSQKRFSFPPAAEQVGTDYFSLDKFSSKTRKSTFMLQKCALCYQDEKGGQLLLQQQA